MRGAECGRVGAVVSGCHDHCDALSQGVGHAIVLIVRVQAAKAEVYHVRAVVRRVPDAERDGERAALPLPVQHSDRHDAYIQVAGYIQYYSGDVCAVSVFVLGLPVVLYHVPAAADVPIKRGVFGNAAVNDGNRDRSIGLGAQYRGEHVRTQLLSTPGAHIGIGGVRNDGLVRLHIAGAGRRCQPRLSLLRGLSRVKLQHPNAVRALYGPHGSASCGVLIAQAGGYEPAASKIALALAEAIFPNQL